MCRKYGLRGGNGAQNRRGAVPLPLQAGIRDNSPSLTSSGGRISVERGMTCPHCGTPSSARRCALRHLRCAAGARRRSTIGLPSERDARPAHGRREVRSAAVGRSDRPAEPRAPIEIRRRRHDRRADTDARADRRPGAGHGRDRLPPVLDAHAGADARRALPHHPAARRRRHGRGLPGVGRGARRRRRAEGDSRRRRRRSGRGRRRSSGGSSASCCSPARSRTSTSSAFTTSARSTASSTSRCRTSRARTWRRS